MVIAFYKVHTLLLSNCMTIFWLLSVVFFFDLTNVSDNQHEYASQSLNKDMDLSEGFQTRFLLLDKSCKQLFQNSVSFFLALNDRSFLKVFLGTLLSLMFHLFHLYHFNAQNYSQYGGFLHLIPKHHQISLICPK